jgi:hypothetical protein
MINLKTFASHELMKKTLISKRLGVYFMVTTMFLAVISTSIGEGLIKTTYGYGYGYGNGKTDENIQDNVATKEVIASKEKKSSKKEKRNKKHLKNSRNSLRKGEVLIQSGKGFKKNSKINLYFSKPDGTFYPPVTIKTDGDGKFSIKYLVTKPAGTYKWYAVVPASGKKTKTSSYKIVR